MAPAEERDLARAVGNLEGTVRQLIETWTRQDDRASEQLGNLTREVAELTTKIEPMSGIPTRVAALEGRMGSAEEKLTNISPRLAVLSSDQDRRQGVAGIGRIIIAVFGGAAGMAILKKLGLM